MSVSFNVRAVGPRLLSAVRQDPTLTTALCDSILGFDAAAFEQSFLDATPADEQPSRRASFELKRKGMIEAQQEVLSSLRNARLADDDLGTTLRLGRSWWAMEAMIDAPAGRRLIAELDGEEVGEEVGHGPARLLSPSELASIVADLDRVVRTDAEVRFRAQEQKDIAQRRAKGLPAPSPLTDEEFEQLSWRPLCALRDFVRGLTARGIWLMKWYD